MRHLESRLTQKGQVTIPAEVRARLGLKPKDIVAFELVGDEVKLKVVRSGILAGYGAVNPKNSPEDWAKIREEMELAMAEEVAAEDEKQEGIILCHPLS